MICLCCALTVVCSLQDRGIGTRIVSSHELSHKDVAGASAVFSAGGDGTFLQVGVVSYHETVLFNSCPGCQFCE